MQNIIDAIQDQHPGFKVQMIQTRIHPDQFSVLPDAIRNATELQMSRFDEGARDERTR